MYESFKQKMRGDGLTAEHVNKLSNGTVLAGTPWRSSYIHTGPGKTTNEPPEPVDFLVIDKDFGDVLPNAGTWTCSPRYWDVESSTWKNNYDTYESEHGPPFVIDVSQHFGLGEGNQSQSLDDDIGSQSSQLFRGDVVTGKWDPMRQMYTPIFERQYHGLIDVSATSQLDGDGNDIVLPEGESGSTNYVEFALEASLQPTEAGGHYPAEDSWRIIQDRSFYVLLPDDGQEDVFSSGSGFWTFPVPRDGMTGGVMWVRLAAKAYSPAASGLTIMVSRAALRMEVHSRNKYRVDPFFNDRTLVSDDRNIIGGFVEGMGADNSPFQPYSQHVDDVDQDQIIRFPRMVLDNVTDSDAPTYNAVKIRVPTVTNEDETEVFPPWTIKAEASITVTLKAETSSDDTSGSSQTESSSSPSVSTSSSASSQSASSVSSVNSSSSSASSVSSSSSQTNSTSSSASSQNSSSSSASSRSSTSSSSASSTSSTSSQNSSSSSVSSISSSSASSGSSLSSSSASSTSSQSSISTSSLSSASSNSSSASASASSHSSSSASSKSSGIF